MRIVFMGTPDFAVAPLKAMIEAGYEIAAVVTQPDKQKGRGKEIQMTPVKECAVSYGIPVLQPVRLREPEAVNELRQYQADLFVVAAFGQILSEEILTMPKFGCVNIHASLLPKYRGAAPIQWVILNGEKETGVTIQQMAKGIDTGDMLMKTVVPIAPKETGASLHDKLMEAGAELILKVLPLIQEGKLIPEKQREEEASHTARLTKSMGKMDWSRDAASLERLVRGLNSWPSAYTTYKGKTLKLWETDVEQVTADALPGTVVQVEKDFFDVAAGEGTLRVREVQLEGKRRMTVRDFLLGYDIAVGMRLGEEDD